MVIICRGCQGTGTSSAGIPCSMCGGDGEIDLRDEAFHQIGLLRERLLRGQIWSETLTNLASIIAEQASQRVALTSAFANVNGKLDDLQDKLNDVMDKCNDIFEKVSE